MQLRLHDVYLHGWNYVLTQVTVLNSVGAYLRVSKQGRTGYLEVIEHLSCMATAQPHWWEDISELAKKID